MSKGVGRKISRGWGTTKKDRKIVLLSLFHGGGSENPPKNRKKAEK